MTIKEELSPSFEGVKGEKLRDLLLAWLDSNIEQSLIIVRSQTAPADKLFRASGAVGALDTLKEQIVTLYEEANNG